MIGRRFIVYFALLAVVTIVTTVAAEYHFIDQSIEHSVHQNLHFARSVSRFVGGMVNEEGEGLTQLIDRLPDDVTPAGADVSKLLAEHQRVHSPEMGYGVYDAERRTVAALDAPGGPPPPSVLLPALRRAEETDEQVVTDLWRGFDGKPRVTLVRGRKHDDGWRAAIANLRLDGDRLKRLFGYFRLTENARLQLLDSRGIVLYSSRPEELYKSGVHGTYFSDRVRPGQPVQMRCHSCHEDGEKQVRTAEFTTVVPVNGTGWSVTIREGEAELFGPLHRSALTHAVLFAILFGAFVAFFILLWRRVMLPLRQLARAAAAAMEPGEAISDLPLREGDEFAQLQWSLQAATRRRARETGKQVRVRIEEEGEVSAEDDDKPLDLGGSANELGGAAEQDGSRLRNSMQRPLTTVTAGLARLEPVKCAIVALEGAPLNRSLTVASKIGLSDERKPEALMNVELSKSGVLNRDALADAGLSFDGADEVRCLLVREFKVLDQLRVRLWLGLSEGGDTELAAVKPLVGLFSAQVHAVVERTALFEELQQRHEQKNRLLRHLFDAESRERQRIAREIHDETAQDLTALLLVLETFPIGDEEGQQKLDAAKSQVSDALEGIDRLIQRLRPAVLDDLGLLEALRSLGQKWLEPAGIAFDVQVSGSDLELPAEVESTVYRVFQEASTNAIRHSGGDRVDATLEMLSDRLRATFRDNGKGMDPGWLRDTERNPRWGMLGMRERILQLGGTIRFESPKTGGLQITIEVPFGAERGNNEPAEPEEQPDGPNHSG